MTDQEARDQLAGDMVYRKELQEMIRNDNEVSNHRTTWLSASQGILFVAAGTLKDQLVPFLVVAAAGIVVAASVGHALRMSFRYRRHWKDIWQKRVCKRGYDMDEVLPLDAAYQPNEAIKGLQPGLLLPWVFIAAWIALSLYYVHQLREVAPRPTGSAANAPIAASAPASR